MNNKGESDFIVMPSSGVKYVQGELVHEDEISLLDLWRIFSKRKKLFFGALIFIISSVAIWIYISKPVYESRSVLLIGKIAPVGQLESPQVLMQRLRETYEVDDSSEGPRELPLVKDVSLVDKAAPDVIEISVWGRNAVQAQSFLRGVVGKILREHDNLYKLGVAQQNQLLDSLQIRHKEIQKALMETREKISQAHIDPSISGLLALEIDKLSSQLVDMDQKEAQLRLSLSQLQSKETEVIKQPTLTVRQIKPKPARYMAIAAVIAALVGMMLVYIAEFFSKIRNEGLNESTDVNLPR